MNVRVRKLGRYELLELVSRSARSEVFRARSEGSQRVVAVKRRTDGDDLEGRSRLYAEGKRATALRVDGVPRLLDIQDHEGDPFLVLEWIDAADLGALLKALRASPRGIPFDQAVRLVARLADVLGALHEARDASGTPFGFVHGDVRPSNLLVDGAGSPFVVDLDATTTEGERVGEAKEPPDLAYAPPERLRGISDVRSDVFSLAACAYELFTGSRLYPATSDEALRVEVRAFETMPSMRALRPELPEALDDVVRAALARDPAARPASMQDFRRQLYGAVTAALLSGPDLDEANGDLATRLLPTRVSSAPPPAPPRPRPEAAPDEKPSSAPILAASAVFVLLVAVVALLFLR